MMSKNRTKLASFATVLLALSILAGSNVSVMARDAWIKFSIVKAGFILGVGGGSGSFYYRGEVYPISVGGVSVGATIGASVAELSGTVRNLRDPSDIIGTYSAVGGSGAYVVGVKAITLQNENGVIISVAGPQAGLEVSLDLGGMSINLE
jgi:hypothetical protein